MDFAERGGIPVHLVVTQNGAEALAYLKGEGEFGNRTKHPFPHVVVTDLKMPRVSGLNVLAWLKEHEEYRSFPKIVFSGSNDEHEVEEAYRLGANTFFQKPVALHEFQDLVYHLVCY
jgi:CheY-like chemotaxis protein